jgi:uncharacterized protein (DUF2147 family)
MKNLMLLLMMSAFALNVSAQTIVGKWKSIDDETGKAKSIIKIYKAKDGKYYGKIEKLLNRGADEEKDPYCKVCPKKDYRYNKRVITMNIISKMKASSDAKSADSGTILDPKSGKIYKCSMKVSADGKKLNVRGYIGFSLLGRTQTWIRMDK